MCPVQKQLDIVRQIRLEGQDTVFTNPAFFGEPF